MVEEMIVGRESSNSISY